MKQTLRHRSLCTVQHRAGHNVFCAFQKRNISDLLVLDTNNELLLLSPFVCRVAKLLKIETWLCESI